MKWSIAFSLGVCSIITTLFLASIFLDPYGLYNTHNKRTENLNSEESFLYPLKIQPNSYYLVGTSRTLAFDIQTLENNLKKKTYFLGISGSNISHWLLLIQKIKEKQSNVILGLDLFSLNATQIQDNSKTSILLNQAFRNFNFFTKNLYFLNSSFIQACCSSVLKNFFIPSNQFFITQNLNNVQNTFQIKEEYYKNFRVAKQELDRLSLHLSAQDIVIIFPEYWKYYLYYSRQQSLDHISLLDEYIQVIKTFANQTKAQIWIFGGINSITLQDKNFDYDYWHFKPKIADLIIKKIFKQEKYLQDFGFQIDRNNIERQMQEWKNKIIAYSLRP